MLEVGIYTKEKNNKFYTKEKDFCFFFVCFFISFHFVCNKIFCFHCVVYGFRFSILYSRFLGYFFFLIFFMPQKISKKKYFQIILVRRYKITFSKVWLLSWLAVWYLWGECWKRFAYLVHKLFLLSSVFYILFCLVLFRLLSC